MSEKLKRCSDGGHCQNEYLIEELWDHIVKLEAALQEIAERAGTNRNANWARRRALEALKEEVEG